MLPQFRSKTYFTNLEFFQINPNINFWNNLNELFES